MRGEFGRALGHHAMSHGHRLSDLAAHLGWPVGWLVDHVCGRGPPPDPETVRRIAEFLGVPVHVLEEPARLSREAWMKGEK